MLVGISRRSVSRRFKVALKMLALFVMILYVLPKLLGFCWQFYQQSPKIRDNQIMEKPLRVISEFVEII